MYGKIYIFAFSPADIRPHISAMRWHSPGSGLDIEVERNGGDVSVTKAQGERKFIINERRFYCCTMAVSLVVGVSQGV